MNGSSLAEKLLSRAARHDVRAGDIAICSPDVVMGTDGSIPMALDYLAAMQERPAAPRHPDRLIFALDHYGETSGANALKLQVRARDYARAHGIRLFDIGDGIGHQLLIETCDARPGRLVVGADSHSTAYGAMNAFGSGIGSSDLAGIMQCGQLWLKVPPTIRVELRGRLASNVSAKDLALSLARRLGADGANYKVLEFGGTGVSALDMDDRIVLSNMSVEVGAKAGIMPFDGVLADYLAARGITDYEPISADADARYEDVITIELGEIVPQLALPHQVDNVIDLANAQETSVDMVYLGTCTGGRVKDYEEALEVLRVGGGVAPGVRVIVTPASAAIESEMRERGMLAEFAALGAVIQPPGCGACCGTCGTIPADGETIISTANRNFKGRMGNSTASIYLASPRACALAAVKGRFGGSREGSKQ